MSDGDQGGEAEQNKSSDCAVHDWLRERTISLTAALRLSLSPSTGRSAATIERHPVTRNTPPDCFPTKSPIDHRCTSSGRPRSCDRSRAESTPQPGCSDQADGRYDIP